MTAMWANSTIGELCDQGHMSIQTGPFGSQLHAYDYQPTGVPVIPTEAIGRRILRTLGLPLVSEETAERLNRHRVRVGDILFARRGVQATGFSAIVQLGQENWICGTGAILLRTHTKLIDPQFLSFWLASDNSINWLKAHAVGAVMPNLNESVLRGLPITLPPLPEQRAIAAVLGALDDKIEVNRRMNTTLEHMAQALFKSWFVDFDPVHANRNGETMPGLAPDVQALFPTAFEDSALDEIPQGWGVGQVGDLVQVVGGSTPSTKEPAYWDNGSVHWATPKDLSNLNDPVLLQTERKITEAGLAQISSGLLPPATVLLSSRAPIGYLAITEIPVAINQGFIALKCDERHSNHYVRHWARTNMDMIIGRANGTTFLEISKANFRPLPMLLPDQTVLSEFQAQAQLWHGKTVQNLEEIRILAATRDALLPKLLSGEVRVHEAEKITEEIL